MDSLFDAAIVSLREKYEILGDPIDLSDYFKSGGQNIIFSKLKNLYQSEFSPTQRIVIVQPQSDRYLYDDHPSAAGESLTFLQRSLKKIDISNFFVIVITGNDSIELELDTLKNQFHDDHAIGYHLVSTNYTKKREKIDSFCVLPWMHLFVNTDGNARLCGISTEELTMGDLKENTVEEIFNNDRYRRVRRDMIAGFAVPECRECTKDILQGRSALKDSKNTKWQAIKADLIKKTHHDGSIDNLEILSTDLRYSNICNLKCRTCSGTYSSLLAIEEKKLFNDNKSVNAQLSIPTQELIFKKTLPHVETAKQIYFAGGEPLIMKSHYDTLDRLLELGRTDVAIIYNTNFTNLKYKERSVLDYWKKFSQVSVGASIDGHGRSLEYTRHGTRWDLIQENLLSLRKTCPHVKFTVTSTVSFLSAQSIMELQKSWHNQGLCPIGDFLINPVRGSDFFSLQMLPEQYKISMSHLIDEHCSWLDLQGAIDLKKKWQDMKSLMLADDKSFMIPELAKMNRLRDSSRNECFEIVYPQYKNLFNYV